MFRWPTGGVVVAALMLSPSLVFAQIPGVPAATTAIPGVAAAPAAAAAPANNIWSKLCMTPAQKQACKEKLCSCTLVQFLNGAMAPVSAFTGGLLPQFCPGPNDANPADLLKPADSAEGAAARIKQQEAQAKARRAAVRYLGTVDCRRFPEAEAALIMSLRGDENECVRYEAALALGSGCCCTRKVLEALVVTVSGRKTNEPAESSARVRLAAAAALERCLMKYCDLEVLTPATRPVEQGMGTPGPAKTARNTADPLVEDGKQVLAAFKLRYIQQQAAALQLAATAEPPVARPTMPAPVVQAVAQVQPPRPVATPVAPAAVSQVTLPPTGQRDVWTLFQTAARSR